MKVILAVFIFFVFGALLIISNNNLALYKKENTPVFKGLYLSWLNNLFLNIKTLTGNVVSQEWFPKNISIG